MVSLTDILTNPKVLSIWVTLIIISLVIVFIDIWYKNNHLGSLMKWVWYLTVLYSGPLGLLIYYYSGRKQIKQDSIWRKAFRSVSHCYSGCGGGEIVGIFIAVGILALDVVWVAVITFALAYLAGYALTAGPLIQEGVPITTALKDAFISETASITVMEVVAISVDIALAGNATMADPLFWSSLLFSLSIGLLAAYPVNILLIRYGVKEGMHNPKDVHH